MKSKLQLAVFEPKVTAELNSSVTSLIRKNRILLVPNRYKLAPDDLVGHVLFALKHECINLQILSEALRHISKESLLKSIRSKLSRIYQRKLGYLWEFFNGKELPVTVPSKIRYVKLFDEHRYVNCQGIKNAKWRIIFNGFGLEAVVL